MNRRGLSNKLMLWLSALALAWGSPFARGEGVVVASFTQNGALICTNLEPGTVATVEWAPSAQGPWLNSWDSLAAVPVNLDSTIAVRVPLFFRVRGVPRNPNPARLVWINPGTFIMGSPESEPERDEFEGPQTEVTLSYGFWIGRYEVTQAEYVEVMQYNPSYWTGDLNLPADTVRWIDATNYCGRLTELERAAGRLPAGYFYRLPREAEWEYACRAGTTTAFHYGPALRSGMANFNGFYEYDAAEYGSTYNEEGVFLNHPLPVGSYAPNAWGLYDMHGNIWEWCLDWWSPSLPGGRVTDPKGPTSGLGRLRRGGFYFGYAWICRSAMRYWGSQVLTHENLGLRVVLAPEDS